MGCWAAPVRTQTEDARTGVLHRRLVQALFEVVERVLRHVGEPHVGVAPDSANLGLELADKPLDGGGLPRTVGAYDGDAKGNTD